MRVHETQRLTWQQRQQGGGGQFTVSSEPALDFPGSNKFTTAAVITVEDELPPSSSSGGASSGCRCECAVTCNAALPWPMQGTIEAVMAEQAKASVAGFLQFCKEVSERAAREAAAEAAEASATAAPPYGRASSLSPAPVTPQRAQDRAVTGTPASATVDGQLLLDDNAATALAATATATGDDEFYDACESFMVVLAPRGHIADRQHYGGAAPSSSSSSSPSTPLSSPFEEVLLGCVNDIRGASDETRRLLGAMQQQLARMNELMEQQLLAMRTAAAATGGGSAATKAAATISGSPSSALSSSSSSWLLYFAAGAACASTAAAVVWRYKQQAR